MERGRELRADYKMVAKALTRKGNALVKMNQLSDAIATYHKALTENRWVPGTSYKLGSVISYNDHLIQNCALSLFIAPHYPCISSYNLEVEAMEHA